jgi:hypothetical protein
VCAHCSHPCLHCEYKYFCPSFLPLFPHHHLTRSFPSLSPLGVQHFSRARLFTMMGLQTHQGSMPGIQLYGSRCIIYTESPLPRPIYLDGLQTRHNNNLARDNFQAWASNKKVLTEETKSPRTASLAKPYTLSTGNTTLPLIQSLATPRKPFMATAGFPDDIPRFVEIEFAAFRHEYINHHLSYRDPSNPAHTARTISFYQHCMQKIRTSILPSPSKRHDSKVDLTLTDDDTEIATTTEGYRFRKVIDPNTHEIIAFVKSEITTLTPELHASPLDIGHESEPEMNRAWFALNEKVHRDYCGDRQHVCKSFLIARQILSQFSPPSYYHSSIHPTKPTQLIQETKTNTISTQTSACSPPTPHTNTAAPPHP